MPHGISSGRHLLLYPIQYLHFQVIVLIYCYGGNEATIPWRLERMIFVKRAASMLAALMMIVFSMQPSAAERCSINFELAKRSLLKNNTVLKQLNYQVNKARAQYEDIQERMKDSSGYINPRYSAYYKVLLIKQRNLVPRQVERELERAMDNRAIAEKNLISGLRSIYGELMNADMRLKLMQDKLELAKARFEADRKRLEQGLVSELEFEEAEYNLMRAQKDADAAIRHRENACRNLNQYIGEPVNRIYDDILPINGIYYEKLEPLDNYLNRALAKRYEISGIEKDIELKRLEISILETENANKLYNEIRLQHEDALRHLKELEINLEKAKLDIENEIKDAYIDIEMQKSRIEDIKASLLMQHSNLGRMEALLDAGMGTQSTIDEAQAAIRELNGHLRMAIYWYNAKMMKLGDAAGIGPAY